MQGRAGFQGLGGGLALGGRRPAHPCLCQARLGDVGTGCPDGAALLDGGGADDVDRPDAGLFGGGQRSLEELQLGLAGFLQVGVDLEIVGELAARRTVGALDPGDLGHHLVVQVDVGAQRAVAPSHELVVVARRAGRAGVVGRGAGRRGGSARRRVGGGLGLHEEDEGDCDWCHGRELCLEGIPACAFRPNLSGGRPKPPPPGVSISMASPARTLRAKQPARSVTAPSAAIKR